MSNLTFKNAEEYGAAMKEFFESHPDAPIPDDIDSLDLIMRKEYAEEILRGEKPLEFRPYSKFYVRRLVDQEANNYINANIDDDEVQAFCNDIRPVKMIHFHNYNNSWFLDVECVYDSVFSITKDDIKMLQDEYGVHDFDDDLEYYEKNGIKERPYLFYFVIGKVLGTNLEVITKDKEIVKFCGGKTIGSPKMAKTKKSSTDEAVITFSVNKDTFNDIVSGRQTVFEKEILPKKLGLYCLLNEDGSMKERNGIVQLRKYDAIKFVNKMGTYTCKLEDADIEFVVVEDVEPIIYKKKVDDYDTMNVVYYLGKEINQ